jgi:hypothetical protein
MSGNEHSLSLIDWQSPLIIEPLQSIPQFDRFIEDVRIVEVPPVESGDFGFQYQKQQTFRFSNPNGLIQMDDLYVRQSVEMATGTGTRTGPVYR